MNRSHRLVSCVAAISALIIATGCDSQIVKQFRVGAAPGLTDAASQLATAAVNGGDRAAIDAASIAGWSAIFDGLGNLGDAHATSAQGDSVTSGSNSR